MEIVFSSIFLTHHQVPVSDALWELTGGNYRFIADQPLPEEFVRRGYPDYSDRPYVVEAFRSDAARAEVLEMARKADVLISGGVSTAYERARLAAGDRLTFEYRERWLKRGAVNLLSRRLLESQWLYHTRFRRKPLYMLCAGAYVANDLYRFGSFRDRCYKWGYFTETGGAGDGAAGEAGRCAGPARLLWCARFIGWKHPEMVPRLAARLRERGFTDFRIEMVGDGPLRSAVASQIEQLGVGDCVTLSGNLPNAEVLSRMQESDIFLLTSDRNEGWGAVLGEAMGCGCAVVSSDLVGAAPFLVKDGENGRLFRSEDLDSLTEKVAALLTDAGGRARLGAAAAATMAGPWSPQAAAGRLVSLCEGLLSGRDPGFADGPCSKAVPFHY